MTNCLFINKFIKVNKTEYLNSQHADESALTLTDDIDSLNSALDCRIFFVHYSRLKRGCSLSMISSMTIGIFKNLKTFKTSLM